MQKGIDVIWCQVSDMGRAVAFYRDVLGFKVESESEYWSSFHVSDAMILGLHPKIEGRESGSGGWTPTIAVDDLLASRKALEAAGARVGGFDEVPEYAVLMDFDDLDGNPLQLAQRGATLASLGVG